MMENKATEETTKEQLATLIRGYLSSEAVLLVRRRALTAESLAHPFLADQWRDALTAAKNASDARERMLDQLSAALSVAERAGY